MTPDYPPEVVGGIGPYTKEVVGAMAARGNEVHVLACRQGAPNSDDRDGDVFVHRRGWRVSGRTGALLRAPQSIVRLRNAAEVGKHVRELGPFDAVEAPDWKAFGARLPGSIPMVLHLHMPFRLHAAHEVGLHRHDVKWGDRIERRALRRADHVTAPSQLIASEAFRIGWPLGDGVDVIRHAISMDHWSAGTSAAATEPVVLFVGRLELRKGPDLLIRAAGKLARTIPDLHVVMLGAQMGGRNGRAFAQHLHALAAHFGLRCTLLGRQSRDDIRHWLNKARVVALPSRFDNLPMTGLEALAAGRALVLFDRVGLAEVIDGTGAGLVVEHQDVDGFSDALRVYLEDRGAAGVAGEEASNLARTIFDPAKIAAERERAFQRAIEHNSVTT